MIVMKIIIITIIIIKNIRYNNLNIQEDDYTKNIDDFENNENNYYNNNENNYEYDVCNIVNNIFKNNN